MIRSARGDAIMAESLAQLEQQRAAILEKISQLGDFRRGSISPLIRHCGKAGCRCAQPGDPGHGPNLRLTYKVKGKTVSEAISTMAALRKAEREISGFRKFQALVRSLTEVNTKICRLRPLVRPKETGIALGH